MYAIIFSLLALTSTLSGGLLVTKLRNKLGTIMAFASGVLIAVPLFDLIPESLNLAANTDIPTHYLMYAIAIGFIILYILDRYFSVLRICQDNTCKNVHHKRGGLWGAIELSVHSFMDGFAIGTGFHFNFNVGIIVAVAVIAHDFSDGISTVTVMLHSGNSLKSSMRMLALDAIAPVMGAITAIFIRIPEIYVIFLLSFFSGGFLYIGASDLLPEAHEQNPPLVSLVSSIAGFILIFFVTKYLNI